MDERQLFFVCCPHLPHMVGMYFLFLLNVSSVIAGILPVFLKVETHSRLNF